MDVQFMFSYEFLLFKKMQELHKYRLYLEDVIKNQHWKSYFANHMGSVFDIKFDCSFEGF